MKIYKLVTIILITIFSSNGWTQTTDARVDLNPISGTESDWNFNISVGLSRTPGIGLVIEIPEEIVVIPASIKINGRQVWLQNSTEAPQQDSIVSWISLPNGLAFLFKNGLIRTGDNIDFEGIASVIKSTDTEKFLDIREVISQSEGITASDEILANGQIPPIDVRRLK